MSGNDKIDKLTTRKFLLTATCLLLSYVGLFAGKLTGDQLVLLVPALLTIFVGGNVAAKHKSFVEGA